MSIPKTIHYCWFGRNPLTKRAKFCIESWKKHCPDYQIVEWNEDNYDVSKLPYIHQAYEAGKWAFVSDYARLDIIYQNGGIYMDTDVELLKGFGELLEEKLLLAMERQNCKVATGLGFAAEKGNEMVRQMMDLYQGVDFLQKDGSFNLKTCPQYTTDFFESRGYKRIDRTQRVGDALILASEFFCPMDYNTGVVEKTANTIGIHWYEASWHEQGDRKIHHVEMKIRRRYPKLVSTIFCYIYRKGYRLLEYTRKGTLIKNLKSGRKPWKNHT